MSSLGRNRLRIDRGETDMLALQNFFFFFNHHWCYLDNNTVIPHVLTRNHVWQVKLLPHREFLAASDGHIFFVMKDISLAPLRSSAFVGSRTLIAHLGDRLNLLLLLNISHRRPIHQLTHGLCPSYPKTRLKSMWKMPRPYSAECPSGISPHYCEMRAKNTNRKEVHVCSYITTFLKLFVVHSSPSRRSVML